MCTWGYGVQLGVCDDPHVGHGEVEAHEGVPVGDAPPLSLRHGMAGREMVG